MFVAGKLMNRTAKTVWFAEWIAKRTLMGALVIWPEDCSACYRLQFLEAEHETLALSIREIAPGGEYEIQSGGALSDGDHDTQIAVATWVQSRLVGNNCVTTSARSLPPGSYGGTTAVDLQLFTKNSYAALGERWHEPSLSVVRFQLPLQKPSPAKTRPETEDSNDANE